MSLYPKVDATMSEPEKALAYQQNRAALAGADLDQRARILALADRLDLMHTAESSLADWERRLQKNWFNFAHLSIISWHDSCGKVVSDTTTPNDPCVLLPVQNGAAASCRSEGVTFVRVNLRLDFSELRTSSPSKAGCVLRGSYYIELPQNTVQLEDANKRAYNLTTYTGVADLRTLSPEEIQRTILSETHQDGPFDLLQPAFNLSSCQTDSSVVYGNLKSLVVKLASNSVHEKLFSELVPGYSMEPHSVLEHIWQSYVDDKGVTVNLGAQVYYTTFLNAMRPFVDLEEYPIDVAGVFMAHIEPTLHKSFRAHYPEFGQVRPRAAITQRRILTDMLKALIRAEADVSNILEIVGVEKRAGEQFHAAPSVAPALPSVAERTIKSYSPREGTDGGNACFGCGDFRHPWARKINGKWVIQCPMKDKPGVMERAKLAISRLQSRRGRKKREAIKRRNVNTLNYDDLPQSTRERILLQAAGRAGSTSESASVSVNSSVTGGSGAIGGQGSASRGNITLHQDVVVFTSDSRKPPLPISIHSPMAHLTIRTGVPDEEKDCPNLKCVFDSGAALSTANFHFMEAVIRQFPHILKRIYLPEDYAAIVLSGIVNTPDSAPVTTELTVGFEIHLPYSTKDGHSTSLMVAAGPDVAVNVVLGLPFIKATGMVADFVDNVCEARNLLCDPFPMDFKRAGKSIPVFQSSPVMPASDGGHMASVFHVLGSLRSYFDRGRDGPLPNIVRGSPEETAASRKRGAAPDSGALVKAVRFNDRWVPPVPSANEESDYQHQVLGHLGYL